MLTAPGLMVATDAGGLAFHVVGEPRPQGSARLIAGRLVTKTAALDYWRQLIAHKAAQALADQQLDTLTGPVAVAVYFRFPMPQGRPKRLRKLGTVPHWHRPDLDKLCRAVLDGLTDGGLLRDDAQVAELVAHKAEIAEGWIGVEVHVRPIDPEPRP